MKNHKSKTLWATGSRQDRARKDKAGEDKTGREETLRDKPSQNKPRQEQTTQEDGKPRQEETTQEEGKLQKEYPMGKTTILLVCRLCGCPRRKKRPRGWKNYGHLRRHKKATQLHNYRETYVVNFLSVSLSLSILQPSGRHSNIRFSISGSK